MQALQDRLDIQDLSNFYAYYVDMFRIDEWTDCFTVDAVFDETDVGNGVCSGHDEIRAFGEKLVIRVHSVIHLISNHIIWDLTPTAARGTSFAIVEVAFANGERYRNHCRYTDEYKKVDGVWKISKRVANKTLAKEVLAVDPDLAKSVA